MSWSRMLDWGPAWAVSWTDSHALPELCRFGGDKGLIPWLYKDLIQINGKKKRDTVILNPYLTSVFPTPPQPPAGCPTVQLSSDTIYLASASDPTG